MVEAHDREAELWSQLEAISNELHAEFETRTKAIREELKTSLNAKPPLQMVIMQQGGVDAILRQLLGVAPCNDPGCPTCNPKPEGKPN
jgi:hypothetical protein